MYDEMTNQDFICALAEKAHPSDNPSSDHADLMDEAARRIRKLERDIHDLNDRLIDRQKTLMEQAVKLQQAERLLTRCRDSAGRMEMGLYEDIQSYLQNASLSHEEGAK
jgi:hypothetical protein